MNHERAIALLLATANPLPAEDHPEWEDLAAHLEAHPELNEWFTRMTPADASLEQAIQGLNTQVTLRQATPVKSMPRRQWLRAAAAAAVVSVGGASWLARPIGFRHREGEVSYQDFCEDMCVYASRLLSLDHKHPEYAHLLTWMSDHGAPVPNGSLPASIATRMMKGCKQVTWGQRKAGLICFAKEDGSVVHIFSTPLASLADVPSADTMLRPTQYDGREVVGWIMGNTINALVPARAGTTTAELLKA